TRCDEPTAVVRTEHVPASEVEFLRWREERWMKVRHIPAAFLHSPGFVLRHGREMIRQTFTGTTLRSMLGLENEYQVFQRFREERRRHRESLMPHDTDAVTNFGTTKVLVRQAL